MDTLYIDYNKRIHLKYMYFNIGYDFNDQLIGINNSIVKYFNF